MLLPCVKDKCAYCEGLLFYASVCLLVRDIGETLGEQISQHYASKKLANRHYAMTDVYISYIYSRSNKMVSSYLL